MIHSQVYRGVIIEAIPEDDSGWNATADYGNGPQDCYVEARTPAEALQAARKRVDEAVGAEKGADEIGDCSKLKTENRKRKIDLRDDTLHTAEEVASIIKSTPASVRTMTSKGTIPSSVIVRIGRKTLYRRRGLEDWLSGNTNWVG